MKDTIIQRIESEFDKIFSVSGDEGDEFFARHTSPDSHKSFLRTALTQLLEEKKREVEGMKNETGVFEADPYDMYDNGFNHMKSQVTASFDKTINELK